MTDVTGVEWRPAAAGGGRRQAGISAAAPNLSLRTSPQAGVAIRSLLRLRGVFAGSDLLRAKPISLFVLPKRETACDVKEKRALVGKGEPSGGRGVAACGRTIRGAPAVRSAAARPGPVRLLPARPLRLGSVDARLLSHVILSVSEESPGPMCHSERQRRISRIERNPLGRGMAACRRRGREKAGRDFRSGRKPGG